MKTGVKSALPLLLAVALLPAEAIALRCGSDLITEGDHIAELLRHCGEPVWVERKTETRIVAHRPHRLLPARARKQEVVIEILTYNFGPSRLMREVRVEDGVVKRIRTLQKGFL